MNYITENIGIPVLEYPWNQEKKLPYYLLDDYEFQKAELDTLPCIFIRPKNTLATIPGLKKHIAKIQEIETLPVVLILDYLTVHQKNALIKARIPFVVEQNQIYLPFLGVSLKERLIAKCQQTEKLTPSAQVLLFHFLYQRTSEMYTGGLGETVGVSTMQISRAVRQLKELRLVNVAKDGTRTVVSRKENRQTIFEKAKPFLINPIRTTLYTQKDCLLPGLPLAGLSALSSTTSLNPPTLTAFAVYGETQLKGSDVLLDENTQAEIQVWKYSPTKLSPKPGIVDTLSLAVTLMQARDERVEQALEEILANLWNEDK